jgi:transcriptional regulator with XRE-family HTH domain
MPKLPGPPNSPLLGEIGKEVRRRRKALGLSQEELADRAGITRPTLITIEYGRGHTHIGTLEAVLMALGTTFKEALEELPDVEEVS